MIHSDLVDEVKEDLVVNCFQFSIFIDDSQFGEKITGYEIGCELLSVLYFYR